MKVPPPKPKPVPKPVLKHAASPAPKPVPKPKPGPPPEASKPPLSLPVVSRPMVEPAEGQPDTGCMYCPLLAFSADFPHYAEGYQRNAEKIIIRAKEPHVVESRCVSEGPWDHVDVLFVGEAPGKDEDNPKNAKPFVGRSGQLIRGLVEELFKGTKLTYAFTNAVRCRPPLNRDPNKTEIKSCTPELLRELHARKPKVVVPLGNISSAFLTGQTGITILCGHLMACTVPGLEHVKVVPCLHPAYVLRFDHEFDRFADAIALAAKVATGEHKALPGVGTYHVLTELSDVRDLIDRLRGEKKLVTFDTETGGSTPFQKMFPKLLCVSLTNKEGEGYTIPYDHAGSPWRAGGEKAHERAAVKELLRDLFADENVVKGAQNEKFDRQHLKEALGVEVRGLVWDSMTVHLTLDDRRGTHGLDKLAFQFTGMGGYHKPLDDYVKAHVAANPEKGGSYANIPADLLFPYAAMDVDCTLRVLNRLFKHKEFEANERLRVLAGKFFPRLSKALADLEFRGAKVDVAIVKALDERYSKELAETSAKIQALAKIKQFTADQIKAGKTGKRKADPFEFNPGSDPQLRVLLFEYYGMRPTELTDKGLEILAARHARLSKKDKELSFGAVIEGAIAKREWEFFSTKADVLHEYDRQGNELAPLLLDHRRLTKLLGTYIKPTYERLDADGCVHGSFFPHGTTTGRLSSADPNLQNIDPDAKYAYVSRFGDEGVLLSADYSQIELRLAACMFNDPDMIRAYKEGEDVHRLTAIKISGLSPEAFNKLEKGKQKEWRTRAKRVNFGIIYGIGAMGLQTTLKKDGVFMTGEECQKLLDAFKKAKPQMIRSMEKLQNYARSHGQLESFTGRIRRLPEVFSQNEEIVARALRQTVNFPIQSGASDLTLMSLILINEYLIEEGFKSMVILTVHDSLVFDCHVSEVLEVAKIAKQIMENIQLLAEEVCPGADWSWVKVPIVAELEVGVNWGAGIEFDPDTVSEGGPVPAEWQAQMVKEKREPGTLYYENEKGELQYRKPVTEGEMIALAKAKAEHCGRKWAA